MCGNMLLMDPQKSWLLIGRAKLILTNGFSLAVRPQPLEIECGSAFTPSRSEEFEEQTGVGRFCYQATDLPLKVVHLF